MSAHQIRFTISILAILLFPGISVSGLVSYYDFNNLSNGARSVSSSTGNGLLNLSAWDASSVNSVGNGSSINLANGSLSGGAMSLKRGANAVNNNGNAILFSVDLTGLSSAKVTFAVRGTATGFDLGTWSWSSGGSAFADILPPVNTTTQSSSYALKTVDFSSISVLNNSSDVKFRYTLDGATNAGGNNTFDNFQISAVPEPTSLILVGIACAPMLLRRRSQVA